MNILLNRIIIYDIYINFMESKKNKSQNFFSCFTYCCQKRDKNSSDKLYLEEDVGDASASNWKNNSQYIRHLKNKNRKEGSVRLKPERRNYFDISKLMANIERK